MSLSEPPLAQHSPRPIDPVAESLRARAEAARRNGDFDHFCYLRRQLLRYQAVTYDRRPRVSPVLPPRPES